MHLEIDLATLEQWYKPYDTDAEGIDVCIDAVFNQTPSH